METDKDGVTAADSGADGEDSAAGASVEDLLVLVVNRVGDAKGHAAAFSPRRRACEHRGVAVCPSAFGHAFAVVVREVCFGAHEDVAFFTLLAEVKGAEGRVAKAADIVESEAYERERGLVCFTIKTAQEKEYKHTYSSVRWVVADMR